MAINLPFEVRRTVWERDNGICGICGEPVAFGPKMHADHIIPRALGGTDDQSNLRATHAKCNQGLNRGGYAAHSRMIKTKKGVRRVWIAPGRPKPPAPGAGDTEG